MLRELSITQRSYPLVAPFRFARGVKYAADVVTVELGQAGCIGRGESVPYARYGESMASVIDAMEALRAGLVAGMGRDELQARLLPGAARNALDAAMWDLESQAHLIVDPNESWNIDLLRDMQPMLERAGVDLLEQPLPADADDALRGFFRPHSGRLPAAGLPGRMKMIIARARAVPRAGVARRIAAVARMRAC